MDILLNYHLIHFVMINALILSYVFTFLQYFHFFNIILIVFVISNELINLIIIIVCCIHLIVVKVFIALKWRKDFAGERCSGCLTQSPGMDMATTVNM